MNFEVHVTINKKRKSKTFTSLQFKETILFFKRQNENIRLKREIKNFTAKARLIAENYGLL